MSRRPMSRLIGAAAAVAGLCAAVSASAQVYTSRSSFETASGPATFVETFETVSFAKDTPVPGGLPSLFSQNGVTYQALGGLNQLVVASPGSTATDGSANPGTTSTLLAAGDEFVMMRLDQPARAVGFDYFTNGLGAIQVFFLSRNDDDGVLNIIQSSHYVDNGPAGWNFVGFVAELQSPIWAVIFNSSQGRKINNAIDDLTVVAIPEPSTLAMAAAGCAVLFLRRRARA